MKVHMKIAILALFLILSGLSLNAQNKAAVALIDLEVSTDLSHSISAVLSNLIRQEFLNAPNYQILDRNNMTSILKEQNFALSDACNSNECVIEVGKLLGVEKMIFGGIGTLGKKFLINLQMVDVSSGKIDKIVNHNYVGAIEDIDIVIREIARNLMGDESVSKLDVDYGVYISSEPEGASVFINDAPKGNTPLSLEFANDEKIKITLKAPDYHEWFREIKPKRGEKTVVVANLLVKQIEAASERYKIFDLRKKKKGEAFGSSALLGPFGGGHFYSGSILRGGLILVSGIFFATHLTDGPSPINTLSRLGFVGCWLFDLVGAQVEVAKYNTNLKKELKISYIPNSYHMGRVMFSMNF